MTDINVATERLAEIKASLPQVRLDLTARERDIRDMHAALESVLELADKWEHGALRWADPLPVPPYVGLVRDAITEALGGAL